MTQKEMITNDKIGSATVVQHEDAVLKTAARGADSLSWH